MIISIHTNKEKEKSNHFVSYLNIGKQTTVKFISVSFIFSDINECLRSNYICDDQCINTNGSFYCKCNNNNSSSAEGMTCLGKTK